MWQPILATSLLLLGQASASIHDAGLLVARMNSVDGEMARRYVESVVEPIEKRQTGTPGATMTVAEWDAQTMAACDGALEALNGQASNDAGMAVCYNIPYLDNSTGVFQADLRLFTISAPKGAFASIPSQDVMVDLSYVGATVSAVNSSAIGQKRDGASSLISWPRHELDLTRRTVAPPAMAQAYAFVGQINKDLLTTNETPASLEKLIIPTVTLTGTTAGGLKVNATLNTGEASFVSGVFATKVTKTEVIAPIQTLVVASDAPFVLPGYSILIFPIGGIITGIWAVLLIGTIGYGTFGRMQFRDQYRMRSARAKGADLARI